jgi:hypothetical protein
MKKEITPPTPLEEAIKSLEGAIESLDDMIKTMQESQELLRELTSPPKPIGWMETNE